MNTPEHSSHAQARTPLLEKMLRTFEGTGKFVSELRLQAYAVIASELAPSKRVLEVGSRLGIGANLLKQHACDVLGIDSDETFVQLARALYPVEGLRFEILDPENDPIIDAQPFGSFDVIVMSDLFRQYKDPKRALAFVRALFTHQERACKLCIFASQPPVEHEGMSGASSLAQSASWLEPFFSSVSLFAADSLQTLDQSHAVSADQADYPMVFVCEWKPESSAHASVEQPSQPALSVQEQLNQAITVHNQGQLHAALSCYDAILEQKPQHADALHLKAHALLLCGRYREALDWIEKALEQLANVATFWLTHAMILEKLDYYQRAQDAVRKALAYDHALVPAQQLLQRLERMLGMQTPHVLIDTEYGSRDGSIVLSLESGKWSVDVANNSDPSKISNEAIIGAAHDILNKHVTITSSSRLRQTCRFSLADFSISLFNWRDLLCGRVKDVIAQTSTQAQTQKLGAFGYLAGTGQVASKPTRLKFIELARQYPDRFEYIETDKFSPQKMHRQISYVDYKQRFQYIIDIPGHHFLTKLYWMLFTRRTIFYVERPLAYNWERRLKPYEHYIPLAEDLSDLLEKYEWARTHESECARIAANAFSFGMESFSQEHVINDMAMRIQSMIID